MQYGKHHTQSAEYDDEQPAALVRPRRAAEIGHRIVLWSYATSFMVLYAAVLHPLPDTDVLGNRTHMTRHTVILKQ